MDIHGILEALVGVVVVALLVYITKLYGLAYKDQLTDLWTSRYFFKKGNRILKKTNASHFIYTVFFIDVDNLKTLNDTNSHAIGDMVIKTVAETIHNLFRKDSLIARRSGDEFIILYASKNKGMADTAELSLKTKLSGLFVTNGNGQKIFFSATIGTFDVQLGENLESSVNEADKIMLANKKRRRVDS